MSAYTPNFEPAQVIRTYLIQSLGAVPFSYYWLDPHRLFSSQISRWPAPIQQGLPLLTILAVIAVFSVDADVPSDDSTPPRARTVDLLAVGTLLFALPQALIALSPKYQEMHWGSAYLPVYLSRFGADASGGDAPWSS